MAKDRLAANARQRLQDDQCCTSSKETSSPQHAPEEQQDAPRPTLQPQGRAVMDADCVLKAAARRMQQLRGSAGRENVPPNVHSAWVKGQQAAARLGRGLANTKQAVVLQTEHWLEAADPKHRYGTNLRPYFNAYLVCEEVCSQRSAQAEQQDGDHAGGQPAAAAHTDACAGQCSCQCADAADCATSSTAADGLLGRRRTASAPHLYGLDGTPSPETLPQPYAPDGAPAPAAPLPQEMLPNTFASGGAGQRGFFHWLDEGSGADLDLADRGVPRAKLEHERVRYLGEQERAQYEVVVRPADGLLVYRISGELVDTTAPAPASNSPKTAHGRLAQVPSAPAVLSAGSPHGDELKQQQPTMHEQQRQQTQQQAQQQQLSHGLCALDNSIDVIHADARPLTPVSAPAVQQHTSAVDACKPCKWIYVLDTCQRLYVHPKFKGKFHHSSFLQGGAVLAAGGIAAEAGHIKKPTADSGHYRPDVDAFMVMVEMLRSMGADLSDAQLTAKHISLDTV